MASITMVLTSPENRCLCRMRIRLDDLRDHGLLEASSLSDRQEAILEHLRQLPPAEYTLTDDACRQLREAIKKLEPKRGDPIVTLGLTRRPKLPDSRRIPADAEPGEDLRCELDRCRDQRDNLDRSLQQCEEGRDRLQDRLKPSQKAAKDLRTKVQEISLANSELQKGNSRLKTENEKLEAKIAGMNNRHDEECLKLANDVMKYRERARQAEARLRGGGVFW